MILFALEQKKLSITITITIGDPHGYIQVNQNSKIKETRYTPG